MYKKIDIELNFDKERKALLFMHSFLNIVNVIISKARLTQLEIENEEVLTETIEICMKMIKSFYSFENTINNLYEIENYKKIIRDELSDIKEYYNNDEEYLYIINENFENLEEIFNVLDLRIREVFLRNKTKGLWLEFDIKEIEINIKLFLEILARNSKRKFKIVFNKEETDENNYYFNFEKINISKEKLKLPIMIEDLIRDLLANARKYSKLGTEFGFKLTIKDNNLILEIYDNGKGIPSNEIEKVVSFGFRGSNTLEVEKKGGGFGLTKAYYITSQYNGKMYIDSKENKGTKIKLEIPLLDNN